MFQFAYDLLLSWVAQTPFDRWLIALFVLGFPLAYLNASLRYRRLAREALHSPHLAPLTMNGGAAEALGLVVAGKLLRAHLARWHEIFLNEATRHDIIYTAHLADISPKLQEELRKGLPAKIEAPKVRLDEELVLELGPFKLPIGAIVNLFSKLLHIVPVPFRSGFLAAQIHVMFTSFEYETTLVVFRGASLPRSTSARSFANFVGATDGPRVHVKTVGGGDLTNLIDLLEDAAFMILHFQHGESLPGRNWAGLRPFAEGLDAIERFRTTGNNRHMHEAEEYFERASKVDPENTEALYCYAFLLLRRRKRESIEKAKGLFLRAAETKTNVLKALAHTGAANCYIQEFHRLALCGGEVLENARHHGTIAEREWRARPRSAKEQTTHTSELHPWILSTLALVEVVDEGTEENRQETIQRFLSSLHLHVRAVQQSPQSSTVQNVLGWVLMKLVEWNVQEIPSTEGLEGHPAELAEK